MSRRYYKSRWDCVRFWRKSTSQILPSVRYALVKVYCRTAICMVTYEGLHEEYCVLRMVIIRSVWQLHGHYWSLKLNHLLMFFPRHHTHTQRERTCFLLLMQINLSLSNILRGKNLVFYNLQKFCCETFYKMNWK